MQSRVPLPTMHDVSARNALSELGKIEGQDIENRINAIKEQYAPLSTVSSSLSQLAYANIGGPQLVNKILSNPELIAELQPDERRRLLSHVLDRGTQGGPLNILSSFMNQRQKNQQPQNNNSLSDWLTGEIKNTFARGSSQNQPIQPQNALVQDVQAPRENVNAINQPNKIPKNRFVEGDWDTLAKNYKGKLKQGEKAGEYRADAIKDLSKEYKALQTLDAPYNKLAEVFNDKEFKNLLTIPAFRNTQLDLIKNYTGTKKQKELISKFEVAIGDILSNTVKSMGNKAPASEIAFADRIKIPRDESVDVLIPKLKTLMEFKKLQKERVRLAADLIENNDLSEIKALELADKQLNGDAIRQEIENLFKNNIPEEDILHMMEKYKQPREVIMQRLQEKGVI